MPRIYVDTGFDAFNIDMQQDDDGDKLFVKIIETGGRVYSGELMLQQSEPLTPPDKIDPK